MKKLLSAVSINVKNFSGGRFFALYLAFLLAVLLRDTFCFLSFVSRVESLRLAGAVAGCCFFACGAYFSLRHVEKSPERGTWLTPAIVLFFTLLALVRMALPDNNFDTVKYHIYLQENIFRDNITSNFFPGGFQTFSLSLGDSAFNVFRLLLGYRLGTLLNLLVILLLYFQLRALLAGYARQRALRLPDRVPELLAFIAVSTEVILCNTGTYMVDLLSVPLLLEVLTWILLRETDTAILCQAALLLGLATAKLTNAPFSAVLLLCLAIRGRRFISFRIVAVLAVLFFIPLLPYLAYNWISTGNPVFPYYNTVFKSGYYGLENFRDFRWPPKNISEFLFFPALAFLKPARLTELGVYSGRVMLGWLAAITAIFASLAIKQEKAPADDRDIILLTVAGFLLVLIYSWIATTAYFRFMPYIEIISALMVFLLVFNCWSTGKRALKVTAILLVAFLCVQVGRCYYLVIVKNTCWSWYPSVWQQPKMYFDNAKLFLRDRVITDEDKNRLAAVAVWFADADSGGEVLLKNEIPLRSDFNLGIRTMSAREAFLRRMSGKRMFAVSTQNKARENIEKAEADGFSVPLAFRMEPYFLLSGEGLVVYEMAPKNDRIPGFFSTQDRPDEITDRDIIFIPALAALRAEKGKLEFPDNRYVLLYIGTNYQSSGYDAKAAYFLQQSLLAMKKANDNNPYADYFMGRVYEKQNKLAEARQAYAAAFVKSMRVKDANPCFSDTVTRMRTVKNQGHGLMDSIID